LSRYRDLAAYAAGIPDACLSLVIPAQAAIRLRSSFQRRLESSDCDARLSRYRDLAAYAAGISDACRRPSYFLFAGPKRK